MTTLLGLVGPALMLCKYWNLALFGLDPAVQEADVFA